MNFRTDIFSIEDTDFSEFYRYLDEVNFPVPPADFVPVSCIVKNVPEPPKSHPVIGGARFPYFELLHPDIIKENCEICNPSNDKKKDAPCEAKIVIIQEIKAKKTDCKTETRKTSSTIIDQSAKVVSKSCGKKKGVKRRRERDSSERSHVSSSSEELNYLRELEQYRKHQKNGHNVRKKEIELEPLSAMNIECEPPAAVDQNSQDSSKGTAKAKEERATCSNKKSSPPKTKSNSSSRHRQSSVKRNYDKNPRKMDSSSSEEEYERSYSRNTYYQVYDEGENYDNDYYDDGDETFYCEFCHKTMNSRKTWDCHIVGKKHLKAQKMAHPEQMASETIPLLNPDISKRLRVKGPLPGHERVRLNQMSKIQRVADKVCRDSPAFVGFEQVIELLGPLNDYFYYCKLCDAICTANSIIPHVASFKHKLNYLKVCDQDKYESLQMVKKHKAEKELDKYFTHKAKAKRDKHWGIIQVYEDVPLRNFNPDLPGPSSDFSRSTITDLSSAEAKGNSEIIEIDPETSKGDYFCPVCNSHMNSHNMWISHINGKRHIKNVKKAPGELPSKVKYIKSDERAKLMDKINDLSEIIIGLDFISEKRLENGSATYACYLCHSNSTAGDIIDHLKTLKHMTKFLEKVNPGKANELKVLTKNMSPYSMKALYTEACTTIINEKGYGKIEVLVPKC